jgi:uncharacterized protein (DUF983 family)
MCVCGLANVRFGSEADISEYLIIVIACFAAIALFMVRGAAR